MSPLAAYLIRTDAQEAAFRNEFRTLIEEKSPALEVWLNARPLFEWVPLRIRPGEERVTIGILCLLYIEDRICITFSPDMRFIRRGTHSMEEYRAWIDAHCYRPRKQ